MIGTQAWLMLLLGLGIGALVAALLALYLGLKKLGTRLQQQDAQQLERMQLLKTEVLTYQQGSIRMGEELTTLRDQLKRMEDKQMRIDQHDPQSLPYNQAARLVGLGASVEDLTQSCGLSKAEAELVAKLHAARKS
jgi:gas vesicle protein